MMRLYKLYDLQYETAKAVDLVKDLGEQQDSESREREKTIEIA
jgi:hypothetical protein